MVELIERVMLEGIEGVLAGQEIAIVTMEYDARRGEYDLLEMDVANVEEIYEMVRRVCEGGDEIINHYLYNLEIVDVLGGLGCGVWRCYSSQYLERFTESGGEGSAVIECLMGSYRDDLVWCQGHQALRGLLEKCGQVGYGGGRYLMIYSGIDDLERVFHLFAMVPTDLHPEMRSFIDLRVNA